MVAEAVAERMVALLDARSSPAVAEERRRFAVAEAPCAMSMNLFPFVKGLRLRRCLTQTQLAATLRCA